MASLNRVELIGRIGRDPEVRTLESGKIVNLSLATSERFKNKDGEVQENTEWHNLTMFGKLAESADKLLVKGTLVYVDGKLHSRSYEKNGETRYVTEILCNGFQLLSGGKPKDDQPAQPRGRAASRPIEAYDNDNGESDLPF